MRASLSTMAPRDTFTNTELEGIMSSSRRPMIPAVAGVRGARQTMTLDFERTFSSEVFTTPIASDISLAK